MRHSVLLLGVLAATLSGASAHAQTAEPAPPPKVKPKPAARAPAKPAPAPVPTPPPVAVAPPPPPVLPPPIAVPQRPVAPPVPAAVVAGAAGEASPISDGLRVTFGAGSADLNPATDSAIRALVRTTPPFTNPSFSVLAVAPGTEEDPSTPRRLSLSRALAIRSVLITEGVASPRIYVRALGASPQAIAGGPADRADITVAATAAAPSPPSQGSKR